MIRLRGLPGSPGTAWGPLWRPLDSASPAGGGPAALESALRRAERALQRAHAQASPEHAPILFAHLQMLRDPLLVDEARRLAAGDLPAGQAWDQAVAGVERLLGGLHDEMLRSRLADLHDVAARVRAAFGRRRIERPPAGSIVAASELTPSLVLEGWRRGVVGFAAERGSPRSHACIMLRSLGLPAVVEVDGLAALSPGRPLLADGSRGLVVVDPSAHLRARCQAVGLAVDDKPAVTTGGIRIPVVCNAANLAEIAQAARLGADGVGVWRTEHLFAGRHQPPSSRLQEGVYRRGIEAMAGRPVTIRALDAGADKPLPYLAAGPEPNPALGWRGLRNLLDRPRLFAAQVTAILRAAEAGPVSLLLPMVSTIEELRRAKSIIGRCQHQVGRQVPLGAMIEVPAAAWQAAEMAAECDFLSIGTNDLLQYFFAADRAGGRMADRYSPLHPAFLELLAHVAAAGRRAGKPVHLCGELASDPAATATLLGLGITKLSVRPPMVAAVKAAVRESPLPPGEG